MYFSWVSGCNYSSRTVNAASIRDASVLFFGNDLITFRSDDVLVMVRAVEFE